MPAKRGAHEMKPKCLIPLAIIACVMFILPWLAVNFARGDAGMAISFVLFYAINPMFSIAIGIFSGKAFKKSWYLPLVVAATFLLSVWVLFELGEPVFILYAAVYLALGVLSMFITALVRNRHS